MKFKKNSSSRSFENVFNQWFFPFKFFKKIYCANLLIRSVDCLVIKLIILRLEPLIRSLIRRDSSSKKNSNARHLLALMNIEMTHLYSNDIASWQKFLNRKWWIINYIYFTNQYSLILCFSSFFLWIELVDNWFNFVRFF